MADRTRDLAEAVDLLRGQASLLELAHDAIFDCALDGTILYWNHGAETMYGWTKQEAMGRISHEFLNSRFDRPIEKIVETIVQTGRWEGEFSQIDRWGRALLTAGRWALKVDEKGRPAGILKINVDITERKKAEEALRASTIYNRSLIEASLDPLFTISREGKITDANRAAETATGYSRRDLTGRDFADFFTEPDKARQGFMQVFAEGIVRDYELTIRNPKGDVDRGPFQRLPLPERIGPDPGRLRRRPGHHGPQAGGSRKAPAGQSPGTDGRRHPHPGHRPGDPLCQPGLRKDLRAAGRRHPAQHL